MRFLLVVEHRQVVFDSSEPAIPLSRLKIFCRVGLLGPNRLKASTAMGDPVSLGLCFDFEHARIPQLFKFCMYGFLKNQQYYGPFFLLFFRARGVSFAQYGVLVAWSEIVMNLWEVPSGAIADSVGRRHTLAFSFALYIVAFVGYTVAESFRDFLVAFFFFAGGEAFRAGTHKAMIFEWLRFHGRPDLKVQVYGYTRSWSKIGSALSSVVGGALVAASGSYVGLFIYSAVPYGLDMVNVLSYPRHLDGEQRSVASFGTLCSRSAGTLRSAVAEVVRPPVRGFLLEAVLFEAPFRVGKDYLPPLLALTVANRAAATGLLAGAVYFLLFLVASFASRNAHVVVKSFPNEHRAAQSVWGVWAGLYAALTICLLADSAVGAAVCFGGLYTLQNVWRPLLMSRLTASCSAPLMATMLSVEMQVISLGKALLAPTLGGLVDAAGKGDQPSAFAAVGAAGLIAGALGCGVCAFSPKPSPAAKPLLQDD